MSPRPLRSLATALLAVLLLTAGACGDSDESGSNAPAAGTEHEVEATPVDPSASAAPEDSTSVEVEVHVTKDTVEPLGKVIDLETGQKLVLDITAEEAGELHVHSSPEQHIEYPAGESRAEIVINRPGVVEVESHTLDKLVLQLEVR